MQATGSVLRSIAGTRLARVTLIDADRDIDVRRARSYTCGEITLVKLWNVAIAATSGKGGTITQLRGKFEKTNIV